MIERKNRLMHMKFQKCAYIIHLQNVYSIPPYDR